MSKNKIQPSEMTMIMEGLSMVALKAKQNHNMDKVQKAQQLYDRLNDYTTDYVNSQKQEEE